MKNRIHTFIYPNLRKLTNIKHHKTSLTELFLAIWQYHADHGYDEGLL